MPLTGTQYSAKVIRCPSLERGEFSILTLLSLLMSFAAADPPIFGDPVAELWHSETQKLEVRDLRFTLDTGETARARQKYYLLSMTLDDDLRMSDDDNTPAPSVFVIERILDSHYIVSLEKMPLKLAGLPLYGLRYKAGANQTVLDLFTWDQRGIHFVQGGPFYSDTASIEVDAAGFITTADKVTHSEETWANPCKTKYRLLADGEYLPTLRAEQISQSENCVYRYFDSSQQFNTGPEGLNYWTCSIGGDGPNDQQILLLLQRSIKVDLLELSWGNIRHVANGVYRGDEDILQLDSDVTPYTTDFVQGLFWKMRKQPAATKPRDLVLTPQDLLPQETPNQCPIMN